MLNPLLSGALGTDLNLDLVSYKGLAAAYVTLLDLIEAHGGVATVDELLDLEVGIADLLTLTAEALNDNGDTIAAATLNDIAAAVTTSGTLELGELIEISGSDPQAAYVNVLDLVMASALIANDAHAVSIPTAGINIPGVASIDLSLDVIEPPKIASGAPGKDENGEWKTAKTAQVRLNLGIQLLPIPPIPVAGLGTVAVALGRLNIAVNAAQAEAQLASIDCPSYANPNGRVTVEVQPGIAGLALGQLDDEGNVVAPAQIATVTLLGVPVGVTAQAAVPVASPTGTPLEFDGPFLPDTDGDGDSDPDDLDHLETQTVGTDVGAAVAGALAGLASNLVLEIQVPVVGPLVNALLRPLLPTVLSVVSGLVRPVIPALATPLLTPLLQALGVTIGGADVQVLRVYGKQPLLVI